MDQTVGFEQDWAWIRSFREEDDRSAFTNIFNKYKAIVINLSFRFVKDQGNAEEIAQEVFIKIYEKKVKFNPKSKFSTWLYRVTVNASLDFLRRQKKVFYSLDQAVKEEEGTATFLETLADPNPANPFVAVQQVELKTMVQGAVDRLPEKMRSVILLFQFQELSYREIAHILKVTEKTVERRISHAKDRLRKELSKYL
jgi:RNA polymerase sigma-70 factor (ECF subfamily)